MFKRSLKAQALPARQVSPGHICQKLAGGRMVGFLHVDLLLQRQQGQSREIGTSWAPCDQIHSSAGGWMMLYSPLLAFVTCFAISLPGCQERRYMQIYVLRVTCPWLIVLWTYQFGSWVKVVVPPTNIFWSLEQNFQLLRSKLRTMSNSSLRFPQEAIPNGPEIRIN